MLSNDNGIAATVYAPCEVSTIIGNVPLHIAEETEYPFRGTVRLSMNPESPLNFPLRLRIPAWVSDTKIKVNGESQPASSPNAFAVIERKWRSGDRLEIEFPLQPRVSKWFHDSVAVERGALVFSYGIGEDWVKLRARGLTADWQVYPKSQWNYALAVQTENAPTHITALESELTERPFSGHKAAVTLSLKARKFPKWVAEESVADELPQSPVKSDEAEETIKLIPYAAAKLRITAFPRLDLGCES